LRAGLLSDPEVIRRLNDRFVCTTVLIDDARAQAAGGDTLAKQLEAHWKYPLQIMFLKQDGSLISKLNSFEDFPGVHPDVAAPPEKQRLVRTGERDHAEAFLKHLAVHCPD
jgi:hypothetical protein